MDAGPTRLDPTVTRTPSANFLDSGQMNGQIQPDGPVQGLISSRWLRPTPAPSVAPPKPEPPAPPPARNSKEKYDTTVNVGRWYQFYEGQA